MAELPDLLDRKRHVDLERASLEPWLQRAGIVLLAAFLVAALANVFGQKAETARAAAAAAELEVQAPTTVRSGLMYEAQLTITAHRRLEAPALVLHAGWFDGFTINSFSPEPAEWVQRDGLNVLSYGPVSAGRDLVVRLQYQVNPTTVGTRDQDVVLEDAGAPILALDYAVTVFP